MHSARKSSRATSRSRSKCIRRSPARWTKAGGIVLRYTPENYYIARANVLEDNVNLFKTVQGKRSLIEEFPLKGHGRRVAPTLRFEAKGPHLKIIFDGKVVVEKDDTTFSDPGKVGLWTKADSVSAFTGLKIESRPLASRAIPVMQHPLPQRTARARLQPQPRGPAPPGAA